MKKIFAAGLVLLMAFLLTACGAQSAESPQAYSWPVIMIMKYELESEKITEGSLKTLDEYLQNQVKDISAEALIGTDGKILQIQLRFEDYKTFLAFNGIINPAKADLEIVDISIEEKLFFLERTLTFHNPWLAIEHNMDKFTGIDFQVNKYFDVTFNGYYYVLESTFRRTSVTGDYQSENAVSAYYYYFYGPGHEEGMESEIVLFDRFANQPIWYGLGVAGAIVFALVLYLTLRKKRPTPEIHITE